MKNVLFVLLLLLVFGCKKKDNPTPAKKFYLECTKLIEGRYINLGKSAKLLYFDTGIFTPNSAGGIDLEFPACSRYEGAGSYRIIFKSTPTCDSSWFFKAGSTQYNHWVHFEADTLVDSIRNGPFYEVNRYLKR